MENSLNKNRIKTNELVVKIDDESKFLLENLRGGHDISHLINSLIKVYYAKHILNKYSSTDEPFKRTEIQAIGDINFTLSEINNKLEYFVLNEMDKVQDEQK